jgi:hypothetical protein
VVAEANDLKPRKVRVFRYTRGLSSPSGRPASLSAPYRDQPTNTGMSGPAGGRGEEHRWRHGTTNHEGNDPPASATRGN